MRKGFTLIELMVVVGVIGFLAAIITPSLQGFTLKARDARRRADLHTFEASFQAYENDRGSYPIEQGCYEMSTGGDWSCGSCASGCQQQWDTQSAPYQLVVEGYLKELPVDPRNANPFAYMYEGEYWQGAWLGTGRSYCVCARLEAGGSFYVAPFPAHWITANKRSECGCL